MEEKAEDVWEQIGKQREGDSMRRMARKRAHRAETATRPRQSGLLQRTVDRISGRTPENLEAARRAGLATQPKED